MKKTSSVWSFLPIYLLALLIIGLLLSPVQAKKRCKPLLDKLHNVQTQQRKGYSLKRGQSLRAKEDKARDKWWQCEHSSKFSKVNSKKKNKKSKYNKSQKRVVANNPIRSYSTKRSVAAPFSDSGAIVIKSKYQGDKKFAWLTFYQQPKKCQRPKNLPIFASCSENKQAQQLIFEQQYKVSAL